MWFARLNGSRSNNEVFEGSFVGLSTPRREKNTRSLSESLDKIGCKKVGESVVRVRETREKEGNGWFEAQNECQQGERNKVGWGRSTTPLTIFALLDDVGHFWLDNVNQGWQTSSYRPTSSIKLTKWRSSKASSSPIRPFLLSSHTVLLFCFCFLSLFVLSDFPHQSYRRTSPNWPTQLA